MLTIEAFYDTSNDVHYQRNDTEDKKRANSNETCYIILIFMRDNARIYDFTLLVAKILNVIKI